MPACLSMIPSRAVDPYDWQALLDLIRSAFAYMEGRIDPPSSMQHLTAAGLAAQSQTAEIWVIGAPPVACVILTPKPGALYIGKLAVAEGHRGKGLARRLIDLAQDRAVALGLPVLELQTRVELASNQATFRALGFAEAGRTAHLGYARPTSITYRRSVP